MITKSVALVTNVIQMIAVVNIIFKVILVAVILFTVKVVALISVISANAHTTGFMYCTVYKYYNGH